MNKPADFADINVVNRGVAAFWYKSTEMLFYLQSKIFRHDKKTAYEVCSDAGGTLDNRSRSSPDESRKV